MSIALPLAAAATHAAPNTSARYGFISSAEIVERCAQEGWALAASQNAAPRKREQSFAKHMLDLRHPDLPAVRGAVPRLIVVNSHDGTSSCRIMSGMFRFVCSNGLVVGNVNESVAMRHSTDAATEVLHRVRAMAQSTQQMYRSVEHWSRKELTREQRYEFARFASMLRWGDPHRFQPEDILEVRRAEDDKGDVWATFNRLQENTMRGGMQGLSRSGRAATARPLSDITRSVEYNAALWRLAEEVADQW